jgi:hypothetical protein
MMQSWFASRVRAMLAVALAGVLAGCVSGRPAPRTADDAVCRQEAYNDPQVKALFNEALPPNNDPQVFDFSFTTPRENAQYAFRQAVQACMQRRGLITSGGVEPVRQYPFSPLGF